MRRDDWRVFDDDDDSLNFVFIASNDSGLDAVFDFIQFLVLGLPFKRLFDVLLKSDIVFEDLFDRKLASQRKLAQDGLKLGVFSVIGKESQAT